MESEAFRDLMKYYWARCANTKFDPPTEPLYDSPEAIKSGLSLEERKRAFYLATQLYLGCM
jgi:hypothetical protein